MTTKEQIEILEKEVNDIGFSWVVIGMDDAKAILESLKDLQTLQKAAGQILLRNEVKEIIKNL